jgi:signal transduction histidine kinase
MNRANKPILVVDDDDLIRSSLIDILEEDGYRPVGCGDGLDALRHLRQGSPKDRPGLIILDLMLPVMNGWEFRIEQRKDPSLATIPVLALSADISAKAAAIDADAYLPKPVDITTLLQTVELLLLRTERSELARERAVSERMASLGTLAAGVAHEINNPLTFVTTNLGLAAEESVRLRASVGATAPSGARDGQLASLDEIRRSLEEAGVGAARIREIVADIKDFGRVKSAETTRVDLRRVLDGAIRFAEHQVRLRAQLVKDYGELPPVLANERRLGQVFLNLVINAAQAIPEGAAADNRIRIAARATGAGQVIIEVEDSGSGIPPEHLGRIFDPFFTTRTEGEGTGLGLSICHRVVEDLGGTISVTSEVGKGTRFVVTLPAVAGDPPKEAAPADPSSTSEAPGPKRAQILVIDDEPAIGRSIQRILKGAHDVTLAADGRDALARVQGGERYDLFLCDLQMPEMSGMDLHEALLAAHPDQAERMIFMTGGAISPRVKDFVERFQSRLIEKPFSAADLRARVEALLR